MALPSMRGPFPLRLRTVQWAVGADAPGAYLLGTVSVDGSFTPRFVGRADEDLRAGLSVHACAGEYTHFMFVQTASAFAAYRAECEYYHLYVVLDNSRHPAYTAGSALLCAHCARSWRTAWLRDARVSRSALRDAPRQPNAPGRMVHRHSSRSPFLTYAVRGRLPSLPLPPPCLARC